MFKKQIFSNLGVKLSSLALALVLWFSLSGGRDGFPFLKGGQEEILLPVKVMDSPLSPFRVKVEPEKTRLVLTGSRWALKKLDVSEVTLFVNVEGLNKGEYERSLRIYNLPEGVITSQNYPDTVRVTLDDKWTVTEEPFTKDLLDKE